MTIFWFAIGTVFTFSLLSRYFALPDISNSNLIKPNRILVLLSIISLILVAGLRKNIGDTFFYMFAYSQNNIDWEYVRSQKDIGFGLFQMFLQKISHDPQILIFTTALITNLLIVTVLYKYSRLLDLSLFVYITSGMFLTSMNGIRQYMAAAIIFAASKYLFEGKFLKYLLIILLVSTIHLSALIMIPIYFFARSEAWTKITFLYIGLSVIVVISFNEFSNLLFTAIEDSQYGDYKNFNEGGANVIRVAISAAPLILAYMGREKLRELNSASDFIVNMALIGSIFMLISTQNWIFARFSIYFGLYSLILISWIVKVFNQKSQKFIYFSIIILYFSFFYYENIIILGTEYKSDYFEFFSNQGLLGGINE